MGVGDLAKRDPGKTLNGDVNAGFFVYLAHRRICWLFARIDRSRWQGPLSSIGTAAQEHASAIVNDDGTCARQHEQILAHVPAKVSHLLRDRHSQDRRPAADRHCSAAHNARFCRRELQPGWTCYRPHMSASEGRAEARS